MKIRVLGCSGGIGGQARTSSYLVDDDILVDAGTGVGNLSLEEMRAIDYVFLTHAHLDHVAGLPLMADSVGNQRDRPVTVIARAATIDALRQHLFNWQIWPDFTVVPQEDAPFLRFQELPLDTEIDLDGRRLRSIPMNHTIPAVGYLISNANGSLAFSGDTTVTKEFWKVLNTIDKLHYLIIETTFSEENSDIAILAKHLCPSMLQGELRKLNGKAKVFLTHLMPGHEDIIMKEVAARIPDNTPRRLVQDQVFEL